MPAPVWRSKSSLASEEKMETKHIDHSSEVFRINKKRVLAGILQSIGIPSVARLIRKSSGHELKVLAYHRVLNIPDDQEFLFDHELVSASVDDFRWQMEHVRRHYTPISFKTLLDHLDDRRALPRQPILITFDDGFDDNYYHAFPILKSLGIPATIFISTSYIGQPRTFWFDWLCYLCNKAAIAGKSVSLAGNVYSLSNDWGKRQKEIADIFAFVKRLPDNVLRPGLTMLEKELGIEYPESGFTQSHPLSWEQVREMAAHGIEFGSHTVTHPILANIDNAQLREELTVSRIKIEQEINCPVDILAYPVGYDFAFNNNVIETAREAGYRIGASYISGVNNLNEMDMYRIRRLHVERYDTRAEFECMLTLPMLFT